MSHKYVLLKEVCEKASSNIAQKDLAECDGIYPIYGASGYIKSVDFFQQAKDYIAIVKDGAGIGRAMKLPAKSSVIGTMQYVLPNDNINISYLYYAICSMHLEKYFSGATIPHIYFRDYQNEQLPLPTLEEQAKIANVFGRIDYFIKKEKEQLINLDKLVKSRFVEMFGDLNSNEKNWGKESLKHHAKVIVGYPFKSKDYTETGIRIVGGYNLMQGYVVWSECKYWERIDGYEKYLLEADDIVMAMDRPWVNGGFKISKIDGRELPALLIQRTACIRAIDIEQDYLYMLLNSDCFAEHCNIKGSLVPHISNKDIDSFEIFIPPHELQMEFTYFIKQVDKSKLAIQQSLDELETLKKSLMQQYFG